MCSVLAVFLFPLPTPCYGGSHVLFKNTHIAGLPGETDPGDRDKK